MFPHFGSRRERCTFSYLIPPRLLVNGQADVACHDQTYSKNTGLRSGVAGPDSATELPVESGYNSKAVTGPMRIRTPIRILVPLLVFSLVGSLSGLEAQDLQFQVDQTTTRVPGREENGTRLFPLQAITDLLGIELISSQGQTVELKGSRGSLKLTEGRPLLRYGDDYVLLSTPIRKASDGQWYVPEDILEKGLVLVLDGKLERTGRNQYRLETLGSNVVRVDLVNYPDHVAVIFSSSRDTPIRVREFRRHLKVEFEGFSIRPQITKVDPDGTFLREVRFDSLDRFGSFELVKGPDYFTYRQYSLSDPDRQVVGLYGRPLSPVTGRPAVEPLDPPTGPNPDEGRAGDFPVNEVDAPEFRLDRSIRVVTIDPGHGGDDLGVLPTQELLEAQAVWEIARQIEEFVGERGLQVRLTHNQGMNPSLEQRSAAANGAESRAFISLHLGASTREDVRGPVVYVQRYFDRRKGEDPDWLDWNDGQREAIPQSKRLAEVLQRKLNLLFGIGNETAEAPLAVLAPVTGPAVLIELGYLSNAEDRARLLSPEFRRQVAAAIGSAVQEFLQ